MLLIVGSLSTFLLSLALTLAVRKIAQRTGMVAAPREDRWHQKPTALLGGVAIFVSFILGYLIFAPKLATVNIIVGAGAFLFVVGLVDDILQLKPYTKLVAQLVASAAVVYFGLRLPWTDYQAVNDVITVFWLVGITNAINLLDNMDGLASGISVISCVFLVITFLMNGQDTGLMSLALLGSAALGFLVFNFNPASIFMGDCGSMFLGFVLGGMALFSDYGRTRNLTAVLLTPVLILMIPIFDTCVVTVTRKLSGRPVSRGGRDHTSHRLVALGMTEKRAVVMLYAFAAISGALALMVRLLKAEVVLLLIPGFALVVLFVGLYLGKVRVYQEGEQPAGNVVIRVLTDFSYKRRIFEVLLDLVLIALAYYGAYLLRFDGELPPEQFEIFTRSLPLVLSIEMLAFWFFGVYRGLWRYAGIDDLIVIGKSVLVGSLGKTLVVFSIYGAVGPSRAVFILNPLLFFLRAAVDGLALRR